MNDLSALDRKIVYELGNNARITHKALASKIKSKKSVVSYHIQNLIDEKIIWKFVPVFALNKLGIYAYKIYLKLYGLDKKKKKELIEDLTQDPVINWVAEATGAWDLLLSQYGHNIMEFAQTKNALFKKYGQFIQEYSITILEDALVFNRDHLEKNAVGYRKKFIFGGNPSLEVIDKKQQKILRAIKNDGRFQVTKLAKKLNLNVKTIISKISDLEKRGIIQGYTTFLDINAIGLKLFKICIYFQQYTVEEYKRLLGYCQSHRNVIHIIKSLGDWELELEVEGETVESIYRFIEDLKGKHPRILKRVDVVIITKEHKLDFFPEWY